MTNAIPIALGLFGTLAGIWSCVLGIQALKHLPAAAEIDRVAAWSAFWWLAHERFTEEGRRLCTKGFWAFVVGATSWLLCAYLIYGCKQ
jgi:hypothetical protein